MISQLLVPSVCPFPPLQIALQSLRARNRRSTSLMKDRPGSLSKNQATWLLFYPRWAYLKVWLLREGTVKSFWQLHQLSWKSPFHPFSVNSSTKEEVPSKVLFCLFPWPERLSTCWNEDITAKYLFCKANRKNVTQLEALWKKCWSCCAVRLNILKPQNGLHTKNLWKMIHFFSCSSWLMSIIVH